MSDSWPRYYILIDRVPFAVDMMTWARWMETEGRQIDNTVIDDTPTQHTIGFGDRKRTYTRPKVRVSTVFLGLDHNFRGGEPILFETMIFGGPMDEESWRYHTHDQAERGHQEAIMKARIASARIKALMP